MYKAISISTAALFTATTVWAGEVTEFAVGGERFEGYFAAAEAPQGTIIVLPTWSGLSDYEMDRAEMLADLGFNTFAADLYSAGTRPTTMEERQAGLQGLLADQSRMHDILNAAVNEARTRGADPLIVMGYSMGGIVAMELAWSGLGSELGIDGYAIFSGRVSDPRGRMMPEEVAPFFVAHGEADTQVPVSGIVNFVDEVDLVDGSATVHTYPRAVRSQMKLDS